MIVFIQIALRTPYDHAGPGDDGSKNMKLNPLYSLPIDIL